MKRTAVNAIRLDAGNDRNGNPRRAYVVLDDSGGMVQVIDEGYEGPAALHTLYPEFARRGFYCCTFATTAAEYRQLLKHHRVAK